jgi:hypothetical protein
MFFHRYKQTVVTHVHEDGTVDLRYHDDDVERRVAPQYIKINGESLDHMRERFKRERQPRHLCTVIQHNGGGGSGGSGDSGGSGGSGGANSGGGGTNSNGGVSTNDLLNSLMPIASDVGELTIKDVNLKSERFSLIHKWLQLPTTLQHTKSTFSLVEVLLRLSRSTRISSNSSSSTKSDANNASGGNEVDDSTVLFVLQCRLVCLRVLLTLLTTMSNQTRSSTPMSVHMIRNIFDLAGSYQNFPVPSQGEPRARAAQAKGIILFWSFF